MHDFPESPLSSPARKRQRLSSPTYDEQIENLCPQDLQAFEEIDATLSQGSPSRKGKLRATPPASPSRRRGPNAFPLVRRSPLFKTPASTSRPNKVLRDNLDDDPENPFTEALTTTQPLGFASASNIPAPALFTRGKALLADPVINRSRSPTPDESRPPDFSGWFDSASQPQTGVVGFHTFSSAAAVISTGEAGSAGISISTKTGVIVPSAAAIAKAAQLMTEWSKDPEDEGALTEALPEAPLPPKPSSSTQQQPTVPPPVAKPTATPKPSFTHPSRLSAIPTTPSLTPFQSRMRPAPFRSPLIVKNKLGADNPALNTPSTPSSLSSANHTRKPALSQLSFPKHDETPARISHQLRTPARTTLRSTPKFVTPFKPGMKPEDPTRAALLQVASQATSQKPPSTLCLSSQGGASSSSKSTVQSKRGNRQNRLVLAASGLKPQSYSFEQFEEIDIQDLQNINPRTGHYYSFNTSKGQFGVDTAMQVFKERGYSVPKGWIKNHWNLIIWKLAGMVALDPERENDVARRRWSWDEILRQLIYRYEREIKGAARPPFHLITTQDAPASSPMVVCVSDVRWVEGYKDAKGNTVGSYPELEVTDGWYLLRAQIDEPLARAVRRGLIRAGRKIIVTGAKLDSERKEPSEPLEAYNSVQLRFNANSAQMAPWHARLGFHRGPFISTMYSLDPDGGTVAVMDLVVIKVHPIGFIEFFDGPEKKQSSPRNEADEAQVQARWQRRREDEENRAREAFFKKIDRWERILERCEQKARGKVVDRNGDMPPKIESLYDELDESSNLSQFFSALDATTAAWLTHYVRDRIDKDRENARDEIAEEVNETCPPRNVMNFRVLEVQDARTCRRPGNRSAQLTVWDVLSVTLTEGGKPGHFVPGDRFLVTNLGTTQKGSWMSTGPNPCIYMRTYRSSRYTNISSRAGA